jgi:cell wall-associated NlpC family hydrolase
MASVPFPRGLRPGVVGRDVLAVKSCLRRLHYGPTMSKSAEYGAGTQAAVAKFLTDRGYPKGDGNYGPKTHGVLSPHMNASERALMTAVYKKLHTPHASLTNRQLIVKYARNYYDHRYSTYYTQGGRRWDGINRNIRYPNVPAYSDCSSFVTWCYWLVYGKGPDFLNGQHWQAGFTGTLTSHGRRVSLSEMKPADLVFYSGHSGINHVAMYVGNGRVISHGHDPVGLYSTYYRMPNHARSYI